MSYWEGDIRPSVSLFAESCRVAATEWAVSARHLEKVTEAWTPGGGVGSVRQRCDHPA